MGTDHHDYVGEMFLNTTAMNGGIATPLFGKKQLRAGPPKKMLLRQIGHAPTNFSNLDLKFGHYADLIY